MITLKIISLFLLSFWCALCFDKDTVNKMLSSKFQGRWSLIGAQKIKENSPFSKFTVDKGIVLLSFTDMGKGTKNIEGMVLQFLTPQYYNQKLIKLMINFQQNLDNSSMHWSGNKTMHYQFYDKTQKVGEGQQTYYYLVENQTIGLSNTELNLLVIITYEKQIINSKTTLVFSAISAVIFAFMRRKSTIEETINLRHQNVPIILSFTLLFLISIAEFIIGFKSLFGEMSPEAFFVVSGFLNLMSCFQVFRFYHSLILRQNLYIILSWVLVAMYTWLLLFFRHNQIFLIFNSLIFIPEIIYHSWKGQKVAFDFPFILLLVSNQLYILYFKVCPQNIFRESPSYLIGYCIGALLFLQIFITLGQIFLGPRFYIPSFFLSGYHNYYSLQLIKKHTKTAQQCYICLQYIQECAKKKQLMITPCNHIFHSNCLEKWMSVKMECPVDRKSLPSL